MTLAVQPARSTQRLRTFQNTIRPRSPVARRVLISSDKDGYVAVVIAVIERDGVEWLTAEREDFMPRLYSPPRRAVLRQKVICGSRREGSQRTDGEAEKMPLPLVMHEETRETKHPEARVPDGHSLTIEGVAAIASDRHPVDLHPDAIDRSISAASYSKAGFAFARSNGVNTGDGRIIGDTDFQAGWEIRRTL